jgi:hypothetical protein
VKQSFTTLLLAAFLGGIFAFLAQWSSSTFITALQPIPLPIDIEYETGSNQIKLVGRTVDDSRDFYLEVGNIDEAWLVSSNDDFNNDYLLVHFHTHANDPGRFAYYDLSKKILSPSWELELPVFFENSSNSYVSYQPPSFYYDTILASGNPVALLSLNANMDTPYYHDLLLGINLSNNEGSYVFEYIYPGNIAASFMKDNVYDGIENEVLILVCEQYQLADSSSDEFQLYPKNIVIMTPEADNDGFIQPIFENNNDHEVVLNYNIFFPPFSKTDYDKHELLNDNQTMIWTWNIDLYYGAGVIRYYNDYIGEIYEFNFYKSRLEYIGTESNLDSTIIEDMWSDIRPRYWDGTKLSVLPQLSDKIMKLVQ